MGKGKKSKTALIMGIHDKPPNQNQLDRVFTSD